MKINTFTLHNDDCLKFMKSLQSESIDCIVTDPPYGIKRDKGFSGSQPFGGGSGKQISRIEYHGDWDNQRPSQEVFTEMQRVAKTLIIFGGNFFTDLLPVGNHWIVWDKLNTIPTFGDCELAWTNIKRNSVKKVTREYNGLIGREGARYHATQKPVKLMTWIIQNYTDESQTVFDPFMGSGTTGVACVQLGRSFIGCEIDQRYFSIAEKRIKSAALQPSLFTPSNTVSTRARVAAQFEGFE
jgi:DNA modification methylase